MLQKVAHNKEERDGSMDLLAYGMKNRDSKSGFRRAAAWGALQAAKLQANLYERRIEKKGIPVPDSREDTEQMLRSIRLAAARKEGEAAAE